MPHVIFFVFLLFASSIFGQNDSILCPPGTELSNSKDACFGPVSVDNFYTAELTCLQMGGHLPSVTNSLVNEQLATMGSKYFSCSSVWIGMDVRQKWLDGSLASFRNWEDGDPYESGTSCASLSLENDHEWTTNDCTDKKGFICSFPILMDSYSTSTPMKSCGLVDEDGNKGTNRTQTIHCTIGSDNCQYWNIAVMIGLTKSANIKTKLNQIGVFLDKMSDDCNAQSRMFVITPSDVKYPQDCTYQNTTTGGIAVITNNLDATKTTFTTDDPATEIYNMFGVMQNCQYFPLPNDYAGAALIFTDVGCDDVCQHIIVNNQREMIDNLTAKMYSIRFVHVGLDLDEAQCFKGVFSRCGEYNEKLCTFREYDKEQSAASDPELRVCAGPPGSDSSIATVWIIISAVLGFLIIIACVAVRCFFRYKSLKKGSRWNWFVFSSNSEDGVPNVGTDPNHVRAAANDYDEVPREEDPWEIKPENLSYSEQDVLGSGAFATVYLGFLKGDIPLVQIHHGRLKLGLRKEADEAYKVAVKRLPPHATAEGRMDFNNEIEFMKELGYHSHILSLLGIVTSVNDALIVIENCEFGDLLTYVRARKESFVKDDEEIQINSSSPLRTKDLLSIAWQISDGMSYLASKNFIHRDIAARNILLTKSMVAKIGDFGLCRLVDSSLYTAKGGRLPIKWMAPESLKYYEYSLKSDVWSFGVLLFELFSLGEAPYGTVQPQDMPKYLDAGNRLPQPLTCPNEIYELMQKCWEKVVDRRPDIDQLRDDLTNILNSDSTSYGYLEVQEQIEDTDVCEI